MIRSLLTIILTFTIALTGFTKPAYSYTPDDLYNEIALNSFWSKFLEGAGTAIGGVTGTVIACYAVDVLIAPLAPPVAGYLAVICNMPWYWSSGWKGKRIHKCKNLG